MRQHTYILVHPSGAYRRLTDEPRSFSQGCTLRVDNCHLITRTQFGYWFDGLNYSTLCQVFLAIDKPKAKLVGVDKYASRYSPASAWPSPEELTPRMARRCH